MQIKNQSGSSLLELLIYMGLFAGFMLVIVNIFTIFSVSSANSEARAEVEQNLEFAMQQIANSVRNQNGIDSVGIGANSDVLDLISASGNILIRFDATNSTLKKTVGVAGAGCLADSACKIGCATTDPDCMESILLSQKVSLLPSALPENPIFSKTADTIQISLNISYNDSGRKDYVFNKRSKTSIFLR